MGTAACSVAPVGAAGYRAMLATGYSPAVRPHEQRPPMARPQGSAAHGKATGAAPARGQPVEGWHPSPA
ncbi:hypothetical protein BHE74_00053211 [Ensete ventricosum]|nr:hypothetical protein BHE74_00053211 [Ensete ventricosum]